MKGLLNLLNSNVKIELFSLHHAHKQAEDNKRPGDGPGRLGAGLSKADLGFLEAGSGIQRLAQASLRLVQAGSG